MAESPFPRELRNYFRRHVKTEGCAALKKWGKKISAIPEGWDKHVLLKEMTLEDDLYLLGFRRYRFLGETYEKYPILERAFESTKGDIMDPRAFAKLCKQLVKEEKRKKEGPSTQKPIDSFFKKNQVEEDPSKKIDASAEEVGGSKAEELKRKNAGKGIKPPEKKKLKGAINQKEALVVIMEEHSSSEAPVQGAAVSWPLENVNFSVKKGSAIMHGTLDPREFLRGATPPTDKLVLSRHKEDTLGSKVLQASVTACIGLTELLHRME
ncbi:unnamed protein product [Cuscuta europaea]|uniref:Uncharacterized protein n=1 Tax=Cuscuta europaea TaxID=41803 RepID=A0A9P0ZBA2_CUSEU|nr:unnamed protein product [Cuscuta europaea]